MPGNFPPNLKPQRGPSSASQNYRYQHWSGADSSSNTIKRQKTSLDLTQRLERKLAEYNASSNVFKRWLLEIACWTVSALCMTTMVVIYVQIRSKSMTQSERLLNFANILGKVASAALIVPTSEALGQLKWNWFHKSRAMWDFEIFDKASRGPWGAALLLYRTKGRSLAALGALLIVLLLGIDTFFQQVADYPDRWSAISIRGSLPRIVNYKARYIPTYFKGWEMGQYNQDLFPIVQRFMYGNGTQPMVAGNGTRPDVPLSCPATSCTWPEYETLGICSACVDMSFSGLLTYTCLNTTIDWTATYTGILGKNASLPKGKACGYYLNASSSEPLLMSGYLSDSTGVDNTTGRGEALLVRILPLTDFLTKGPLFGYGTINFKNIRNPILDALIVSAPDGIDSVYQRKQPVVQECILSWCVKNIRSSYAWGAYSEEITTTYENSTTGSWPWETSDIPAEEGGGLYMTYYENFTITPPVPRDEPSHAIYNATYSVDNGTVVGITAIFEDLFPSYYTARDSAQPVLRFKNYDQGAMTRPLPFNPWMAPNNLSAHIDRLAVAMTNSMRTAVESQEMLLGTASNLEKFVEVRWAWLIFPFVLLALSLAFLVSTMIKTSKDTETSLWKTSAMPALICGLPEETRDKFTAQTRWDSSHTEGKKVRIRLLPHFDWRVSMQSSARSSLLPNAKRQIPSG